MQKHNLHCLLKILSKKRRNWGNWERDTPPTTSILEEPNLGIPITSSKHAMLACGSNIGRALRCLQPGSERSLYTPEHKLGLRKIKK